MQRSTETTTQSRLRAVGTERGQVGGDLIASGGGMAEAADVDQSRFLTLEQFESVYRNNPEITFT